MNFDFDDLLTPICVLLVVVLVWGCVVLSRDYKQKKDEFMSACVKDRKEYECVAMWRAGNSHTIVMPMPVIVGGH